MKRYESGPQKLRLSDGRQIAPRTVFVGLSEDQEEFLLKIGAVRVVEIPEPAPERKPIEKPKKEVIPNG